MTATYRGDRMTSHRIDWDDTARWGNPATCIHHGTTDDLGDHGRHSDETEEA